MKTFRCRFIPAIKYLARGVSFGALLSAAISGSAWAGKPAEDAAKPQTPAPESTPAAPPTAGASTPTPAPRVATPGAAAAHVVSLLAFDKKGKQTGHVEGFFVSSTGIVATVRHLLNHATRVSGQTSDGKLFTVSGVLAADGMHDLVLLQTNALKAAEFPRADFQRIHEGDEVFVGEQGVQERRGGGMILKMEDLVEGYRWLLVTASASEGIAGSPLFNESGELIGMLRAELKENMPGAAVSIESIQELLKRAPSGGTAQPVTALKPRTYDEVIDDPNFREALGKFESHDFVNALSLMSHVVEHFPESAACRTFVGTFQTQMKSWAAAEESYRTAIRLDPDYALAWGYISIPLYYEGKAAEAVEACKKSIALQRDNYGAWSNLGGIYLMQGNLTAAGALIDELKEFHARAAYKIADRLSAALAAKEAAQ